MTEINSFKSSSSAYVNLPRFKKCSKATEHPAFKFAQLRPETSWRSRDGRQAVPGDPCLDCWPTEPGIIIKWSLSASTFWGCMLEPHERACWDGHSWTCIGSAPGQAPRPGSLAHLCRTWKGQESHGQGYGCSCVKRPVLGCRLLESLQSGLVLGTALEASW